MAQPPAEHAANILGALGLAVADRTGDAFAVRDAQASTTAAALSALEQFLDGPTVEQLGRVVGLSQSGAVRLVDRLERDGLVKRGPGASGRTTSVALTSAGRRAAAGIGRVRLEVLDAALGPLDAEERRVFAELAGRVLVGLMRGPGATRWMCRLCDLDACGRPDGFCPLEREASARYG